VLDPISDEWPSQGEGASCPCPYSLARDGRICRDESAYARGRGGALYCYEHDISDVMVKQYRAQHGLK
jgi:hypothetical protein